MHINSRGDRFKKIICKKKIVAPTGLEPAKSDFKVRVGVLILEAKVSKYIFSLPHMTDETEKCPLPEDNALI